MTLYISTFLSFILFSLIKFNQNQSFKNFSILILFIFLLILIGLRHNVGGDWGSYDSYFRRFADLKITEIYVNDYAYDFINWIIIKIEGEIYLVNLICATLFLLPLIFFIIKSEYFMLSFIIAFTYLITIVGMGYVRQSVAIGFFILGLNILDSKKNNYKFILFFLCLFLGFLFHKSAIILLALIPFIKMNRFYKFIFLLIGFLIVYLLVLYNFYGNIYERYIEFRMESRGAIFRILMNYPSALLYIYYYKYFKQDNLGSIFLAISIFSLIAIFLIPFASTFVDRISLYFIILQVYFWPKFISLNKFNIRAPIYLSILLIYFLTFIIWLQYADHSSFWVPYQTIIFYENSYNF